jgi:hypothetical protein
MRFASIAHPALLGLWLAAGGCNSILGNERVHVRQVRAEEPATDPADPKCPK